MGDKEFRKRKKGLEREKQKEQGMFDGRFRTKSIPDKKKYKRKSKHKKDGDLH